MGLYNSEPLTMEEARQNIERTDAERRGKGTKPKRKKESTTTGDGRFTTREKAYQESAR